MPAPVSTVMRAAAATSAATRCSDEPPSRPSRPRRRAPAALPLLPRAVPDLLVQRTVLGIHNHLVAEALELPGLLLQLLGTPGAGRHPLQVGGGGTEQLHRALAVAVDRAA